MSGTRSEDGKSSGLAVAEDIWPQVVARDLPPGDVLDRRPIHGIEESLFVQPVRNELLADALGLGGTSEEFGHAGRQGGLAAGNLDSAAKRSNVVWFHNHRLYKRACNPVNKPARMTSDKGPCTVISMAVARRKPTPPPRKKKTDPAKFLRGADGRTANDRFREVYSAWSTPGGKTQKELQRACNLIVGRTLDTEKPYVSQPLIDQIIHDRIDFAKSRFLDVLAEALGVRSVWLRLGYGNKNPDRVLLDHLRDVLGTKA